MKDATPLLEKLKDADLATAIQKLAKSEQDRDTLIKQIKEIGRELDRTKTIGCEAYELLHQGFTSGNKETFYFRAKAAREKLKGVL